MKTKKYSVSMKTFTAVVFAFMFTAFLNAQFEIPNPSVPGAQTAEEVRTGSSISYDLNANHTAGEQYRWAVRGGTITAPAGAVVSGDSSVVNWTGDLDAITVNWDADLSLLPIGSAPGEIIVQKRSGTACPSQLQVLDLTQWNNPTATLTDLALSICSGEAVGGNITIPLTGAPDPVADGFTVTYDITATGLTDLGGNPLNATGSTTLSNTANATIALPDGLVNTTAAPIDFVVTLTAMTDDFTLPNGAILGDGTYTITVDPVPTTGDINSSTSLIRR